MVGSSARINYNLRPAKHVERKMMCEAFRRLSEFGTVESYRYIGFGSFYFRDFALIHKALGISNMTSIEREEEEEDRKRFQFNLPYSCVKMAFGESSAVLPTLPWDVRTILWLDYDFSLDASVLGDVAHFCANACAGSVVVISLNAHPDNRDKAPVNTLKDKVGENEVPADLTDAHLKEWGKASAFRRIITNKISEALNIRNGTRAQGSKFVFRQLFNFHYRDGAMMVTVGGLLYEQGQEPLVAKCAFDHLPFVRTGDDACRIEIPKLTYKEIRHLDEQLPVLQSLELKAHGIPAEDLDLYSRLYRYFPNFAEADL
jgi:hypothetical protein